ncbi:dihydrodipicolinate synthase [Roseivivax halodurans JCM 10272]|uniref:Dihydrodipicolinate synthase n=1 Tax=Roseivivax halodurans JCM 10272 TaxID=1449350 RepID=X7EGR2_9RHOB|nr:dihydrodipicolinate synthase family protein [Roseivivax halodurans]ETX15065.1 dihydrodipicolinate synthase [Roseivivax halodurans JCM 10272]
MQGIIAAVPTPVDAAGRPLREPFLDHARWALENGCDGLNILGSTGEATSLDAAARGTVMEWAARDLDPSRLMVGTGTTSLAESIALTERADDLGYGVALVLPPFYYTPPSEDGLVRWYEALHAALGDRSIRIYFYNFPAMTGFPIPVNVMTRLHAQAPDRFAGIKDSSNDLEYCRAVRAALPDFAIFPSSETSLASARVEGFAGCISATVNVTAPLCARIWRGEAPQSLIDTVSALRAVISDHPLIPAVKHLIARRTKDPRWAGTLPPFTPLTQAEAASLDHFVPADAAAAA